MDFRREADTEDKSLGVVERNVGGVFIGMGFDEISQGVSAGREVKIFD